jgi:hypothetical protein
MNKMTDIGSVAAPTHSPSEFLAYETECRNTLNPLLTALLDMAESAGWKRRTAASTLMFLAAQQVSASCGKTTGGGNVVAAD